MRTYGMVAKLQRKAHQGQLKALAKADSEAISQLRTKLASGRKELQSLMRQEVTTVTGAFARPPKRKYTKKADRHAAAKALLAKAKRK